LIGNRDANRMNEAEDMVMEKYQMILFTWYANGHKICLQQITYMYKKCYNLWRQDTSIWCNGSDIS